MRTILVTGMAIAAGLVLAGCAEQFASLDQGLYSAANAVSMEDRVTGNRVLGSGDRAAQIQSANAEMDKMLAQLTAQGGKLNAQVDASGYARLERILARIKASSHFADEQGWKVVLLPDKEFNAFVNGGTYVMVYKGLLDSAQNDDEIAAVIGHEMAHVAANHVGRQQAQQIASMVLAQLDKGSSGGGAFEQSFTLAQEQEADRIGILYSALAGYDPMAASKLWARMYAQQGQYAGMISDHPLNGDRAQETQAIGQKVAQYRVAGQVNPQAKEILVNNVLWQKGPGVGLQAGQGGGVAAVAQTALNTYLERQNAQGLAQQQQARAAAVQAVQKALVIRNISPMGADGAVVQMTYQGTVPLQKLVMALQTDKVRVLKDVGAVSPGATFDVVFEKPGSGIGAGGKVGLAVDEVR